MTAVTLGINDFVMAQTSQKRAIDVLITNLAGVGSMSLGTSKLASAIRWLAIGSALQLIAMPAWAEAESADDEPVVMVSIGGGPQDRAHSSESAAATRQDTGVYFTVSRGSDLVGTPTRVVREQLGDDVATSSYSDQPVIMIGAVPDVSASPLASLRITSRFGSRRHPIDGIARQHAGVDYGAAYGTPIMATGDGTVTLAGNAGGYGLMVKLDHGSGLETRYAHMSRIAVSIGDRVTNGQVIGYVGSTGRSTGSHLHYETRVNGRAVDPLDR